MQSMGFWSLNHDLTTSLGLSHPNLPKFHSHLHRRNSVRVHPCAHPQYIEVLKQFVYMLLPICAQFHYAYGDPHMRTYQSLRKKSCRISLKIAKLVHMGIPICIWAGKGCTCGGSSTKFAYGYPRTHNEIVRILGATYI